MSDALPENDANESPVVTGRRIDASRESNVIEGGLGRKMAVGSIVTALICVSITIKLHLEASERGDMFPLSTSVIFVAVAALIGAGIGAYLHARDRGWLS